MGDLIDWRHFRLDLWFLLAKINDQLLGNSGFYAHSVRSRPLKFPILVRRTLVIYVKLKSVEVFSFPI